jgi:hypothetical protein
MPQRLRSAWRPAAIAFCLACLPAAAWAQAPTTTTHTQTVKFQVVSVDGNDVVVKTADGQAREYVASEDQRFTVDGKPVSVHELKPGMKGTATITTTTTVTPVHVTEVRNGEVVDASGSSVIVRGQKGIQMFTEGDLAKRNVTIMRDGQKVNLSDLHKGDRLTATIVTQGTPKVLSKRQVDAVLHGEPVPAPSAAAAPARTEKPSATAAPAGTEKPAASATHAKKLPKTASSLPLFGAAGALLLTLALGLTMLRGRRPAY